MIMNDEGVTMCKEAFLTSEGIIPAFTRKTKERNKKHWFGYPVTRLSFSRISGRNFLIGSLT
jgi:hypothetical protein